MLWSESDVYSVEAWEDLVGRNEGCRENDVGGRAKRRGRLGRKGSNGL